MALRAIAELRDARRWTRKGRLHDSREQAGQAIVADAWCDVLRSGDYRATAAGVWS